MARAAKKTRTRQIEADPVYNSLLVARFINRVMERGKKTVAKRIVYGALGRLDDDKDAALEILQNAVLNVAPRQEVRSRRVGGATYQIPMPVDRERSLTLAVRWVVTAAKSKQGAPMETLLARELKAAYHNDGDAVAKRETMHRMAEANKAFAHFRW